MIVLKVEEYCHKCPDFVAEINDKRQTIEECDAFTYVYREKNVGDLTITCKFYNRCKTIEQHIKEKLNK